MEDLRKLDPHGDPWLDKARELSKKVHHHLREEENKFFQLSGKILSKSQKSKSAAGYRRNYAAMHKRLCGKQRPARTRSEGATGGVAASDHDASLLRKVRPNNSSICAQACLAPSASNRGVVSLLKPCCVPAGCSNA